MLFQQLPTSKEDKKHLCCVKSVKYLQILGESFWPWIILMVRDVFRFAIIIVQVLSCYHDNRLMVSYWLLSPHFVFCILFAATKYYKFGKDKDILCLMYIAPLVAFFITPSFFFHGYSTDILRFSLISYDGRKYYTTYLLKYILNDNSAKEIKRRIIAVNYYISVLLIDYNSFYNFNEINYFANKHNNYSVKDDLFDIDWNNIAKSTGLNPIVVKCGWFRSLSYILTIIYNILLLISFTYIYWSCSILNVCCVVFIIFD
eukprot:103690_1